MYHEMTVTMAGLTGKPMGAVANEIGWTEAVPEGPGGGGAGGGGAGEAINTTGRVR